MWTAINMCKEEYPKVPCHKPPAKWPKKYDKMKQRKTMVVHFLNEKPDFLEKVGDKDKVDFSTKPLEHRKQGMLQSQNIL